jgi:DNA polymerase (family 10)
VTPQDAAEILRRYALLLDLLDEDAFKARAFANAARTLDEQTESIEHLIAEHRLASIKGVGKAVEAVLKELTERETFKDLEDAQQRVPQGVMELLRIQGLGPKKARVLWQQAKIMSVDELETAIRAGSLPTLPGIGEKTLNNFLESIEFLRVAAGRHHRHFATREMVILHDELQRVTGVHAIYFGGSLRRGCETIGDLDVLVVAEPGAVGVVSDKVRAIPGMNWTNTDGEIWSGATANGFPVELSIIAPEKTCARLVLITGSKQHYQALCQHAAKLGFALTKDGLMDGSGSGVKLATERDTYRALGLEPVPPALRETAETLVPLGSNPFLRPVERRDFRGILHNHSTYSDGLNTIRQMAEAMMAYGYDYLGIADHSRAAAYASGLTPQRVKEQWQEIDALNRELAPFRILKGTEVDILPDGRLDFEDDLLADFDYVVVSIHSKFQMTEEEATARLCGALENPHVDILGHPTGRLLLQREGYSIQHERVIQCAAKHRKAIELNCNPYRLDLDWRWLARCEELGVPVPINPDAHSIPELNHMQYGADVAAKGPLTAANCPSTWTADEFLNWCRNRKKPT